MRVLVTSVKELVTLVKELMTSVKVLWTVGKTTWEFLREHVMFHSKGIHTLSAERLCLDTLLSYSLTTPPWITGLHSIIITTLYSWDSVRGP